MTAPGADSTNGIACAVVLPVRGAMNATTVSSQLAYTAAPSRRPGAQQLAEREPRLARVNAARVCVGEGAPQLGCGAGDREPGQRRYRRVAGERRDRLAGDRPAAGG